MRPFPRKSFRPSQGPLELKALLSGEPPPPVEPSAESNPAPNAPEVQTLVPSDDRDSIASTPPPREVVAADVTAVAAPSITTASADADASVPAEAPAMPVVVEPPSAHSEDGESVQTDKEVADLLLDVEMLIDEPDEDVDMELEDEEEGLNPPISLGGLAEPMFGVEDTRADLFSLSSRPLVAMSPVFSPALSPAAPQSNEVSREPSVEDVARPATPELPKEPLEPEETPPLGRFKVSSLAYLMDKNLSVSPPHSPAPTSIRSLTPSTEMEEDLRVGTLFTAMQDVFVLKMQKMDPELKAKFVGHLQEQFGVQITETEDAEGAREAPAGGPWASLPESVVRQIMSEHSALADADAGSEARMAVDGEFAELADEFTHGSAGQLKDDLEDQLKALVGTFADELAGPLRDALTLQLKDAIIVQVADQMRDALVVQGEEAQVEFEWRRRFLERQLWAEEEPGDGGEDEDLSQHPLHHLFLSKSTAADMDLRVPITVHTPLLC
ncbi:hypothetical protein B0H15DRAFT_851381 [Mycena belliarum]|uniref:Uncharacterized protein n=1 Tax=Mycena belliarum TaxID=1033014 RepID=A0AAD6XRT8_9AGAR|nr:hypothetical protein B0H15DRAFT_851381 [Mycena belliae]